MRILNASSPGARIRIGKQAMNISFVQLTSIFVLGRQQTLQGFLKRYENGKLMFTKLFFLYNQGLELRI